MGIRNFRTSNITKDSVQLTWQTTVAASTAVDFGPVGAALQRQDSGLADSTDHSFILNGLDANTAYSVAAVSFDNTDSFAFLRVDDGSSPQTINTLADGGGTQVGPAPTLSGLDSNSVTVSWRTVEAGVGMVYYTADGGTELTANDDNDAPANDHTVKLEDLIGGTHYSCRYETDLDASDVTVVSEPFFFNTQPSVSVDPPGHVAIGSHPVRVLVGQTSTITVQVLKRDGSGQVGIPVAFSKGVGRAEGNLSADHGVTDAQGLCKVTFTVTGIPAGRKKARRFIVALVGAAGGRQKRRRAVVVGLKA